MSTTTYLELFKHDDPANNTSEFDVDKSLNENWDKIDENAREVSDNIDEIIDKVKEHIEEISNIKAKNTEQDKYISELEAENSRLREDLNGLPKRQASGESIDLSDSAEMRCDLNISGNSKQKTRSGKNKFIPLPTGSNSGVAITLNMDGTYNLEGTAVNNSENINYIDIEKSGIKEGLTYILSATKDLPEGVLVRAEIYNGKTWVRQFVPSISSTNKTSTGIANFTNATRIRFLVLINSGITVNIKNIGFQLEEGTIATDYEQYGVMPSTGYPSEVECCGDNINLFDGEIENGGYSHSTGAKYNYSNTKRNVNPIPVKSNTTYSLSYNGLSSETNLLEYKSDNTFIKVTTVNGTFTTSSDTKYINFYRSSTNFNNIKLEESSIATPYSPYGQGCINEVICNKNMLNVSVLTDYFTNGIILTKYEGTNKIKLNGTSTDKFTIHSKYLDLKRFKIGKKYSLSKDFSNINFNFEVFENGSNTASIWKNSIIMQESYTKIRLYLQNNSKGVTFNNQEIALQLEEGDATEIVEHKEQTYTIPTQQPFRSVGNTRDTFIKKNNKWYERHYIKRLILNGTETYGSYTNTKELLVCYLTSSNLSDYKQGDIKSNYFTETKTVISEENKNCIYANTNNIQFINTNVTTIEEFKAWLSEQYNAGTPVYVDYILETPLDIKCTEEQNTILDKIEKEAKTYKNITHMYSTDNVSPVIDVTYKKDIETLITNIEQAILSQGGNI